MTQLKLIENDSLKGAFNKTRRSTVPRGLQDNGGRNELQSRANPVTSDIDHKMDEIIKSMRNIQGTLEVFSDSIQQLSSGVNSSGGGGGMDDEIKKINEKISSIETKSAVNESVVKGIDAKIDKLDIKLDKLASKEYLDGKISESQNALLKYMITTAIATTVAIISIVKFL